MIKLTYKEAKDFAIIPTIELMKKEPLPFRFNYWLLKIYRKLKKEMDVVDQGLRDVLLDFIVKDADGKPVPPPTPPNVVDADGTVHTPPPPTRDWQYAEGGEALHKAAFKKKSAEALEIEFTFPGIEPLDYMALADSSLPLEQLAGIEPLCKEYQEERASESEKKTG